MHIMIHILDPSHCNGIQPLRSYWYRQKEEPMNQVSDTMYPMVRKVVRMAVIGIS